MQICFDLHVNPDTIDHMVQRLRDAAAPFLDTAALFGFELAVTEALTNILRHAYGANEGTVRLAFSADAAGVTVDLLDQGKAGPSNLFLDARTMDEIDLMAVSGRGIPLINHYATVAEFWSDQKGNHLHMMFAINRDVHS